MTNQPTNPHGTSFAEVFSESSLKDGRLVRRGKGAEWFPNLHANGWQQVGIFGVAS